MTKTSGKNSTAKSGTYLDRLATREASRELTGLLVLGYGFGIIAVIFGAFNCFLVIDSAENFWRGIMTAGFLLVGVTLVAPFALRPLERLLRSFGNIVGGLLMKIVLTALYGIFIVPVGIMMRRSGGNIFEGDWRRKELPRDIAETVRRGEGARRRNTGFLDVCAFFIMAGKAAFLPLLILLLSLGLALFFLQTSVIAPFIYTLF